MLIRQETPADYEKVHQLVKTSFATTPHADGTEADYLDEERKKTTFIPELSLVVETDNNKIIGQILLYRTTITTPTKKYTQLLLSPICVHPQNFRQGIARAMIQKAFTIAKKLGYNTVFLCGDPKIYKKLGFRPTHEFNIHHIKDHRAEWSMAIELNPGSLDNIEGTINTN